MGDEISNPSLLQVPSAAQVEASLQGSLGYAVRASQDLCQGKKEQRSSIGMGMKNKQWNFHITR